MSFKDELKDSIKTGISEALGEALKTKSFKDIKAESAFNSKSVIEKTLGGVFQTILASNPVTLLLEKNFRLTEKLFSGTKFIGNLTKGLIGNALKNTIGKALQGINKNNKILPNSKQTLVTANKSLNIPAINSLQITSKNCLIKADRITLAYTGTRANLFNSGVMNRFTNTGLLPNLQDSPKLIQAKSIRTVSSSIAAPKLPDKNSLTAIKALQGINKNTMALAKIGKTIVTGIKTLAIPILLIAGIIASMKWISSSLTKLPDVLPKMGQNRRDQEAESAYSIANPQDVKKLNERAKTVGAAGYRIVTSKYGWRTDPFDKTKTKKIWHGGTDFGVPLNTPVYSPFDGIVTKIGNGKYNGIYIDITEADVDWNTGKGVKKKNARTAKFLHLNSIAPGIKEGTIVGYGEIIAYSGNTGKGTGPHLDARLIDPRAPLDKGAIRARTVDIQKVKFGKNGEYTGYGAFAAAMAEIGGIPRTKVYSRQKPNIVQAKINDVKDVLDEKQAQKEYEEFYDITPAIKSKPKTKHTYNEVNKNEIKAQMNSDRLNANRIAAEQQKNQANKSLIASNSLRKINVPTQPQSTTNIIYGITDNIDRLAASGESLDIA